MDRSTQLQKATQRIHGFLPTLEASELATVISGGSALDMEVYIKSVGPQVEDIIRSRDHSIEVERELACYCATLRQMRARISLCETALRNRLTEIREEQRHLSSVHQLLMIASTPTEDE